MDIKRFARHKEVCYVVRMLCFASHLVTLKSSYHSYFVTIIIDYLLYYTWKYVTIL